MSQNSIVLPTTGTVSGLQMTQDVNNALDTLNTLASGTAAPGSPEAGQLWHDTANNLIKIRDQANANWIVLGGVDETNKLWLPSIGGGTATIASAATVNLGSVAQTSITITGTTTITSFGASMLPGQSKLVTFAAGLTLTYNATSMILPGAANISTAVGDQAVVQCIASGNYQVIYQPANGKSVISSSAVPYFSAYGCLPTAISGSNTSAQITVSSGQVADATGSVFIASAGYTWKASNGNAVNGTDAASSTLANSTTYHVFLITGGSGTGTFASASLTPAFPAGYNTYTRRIFSFNANSSGAPIPYTAIEVYGGSIRCWLATQTLDISTTTLSTSRTLFPLNVPAGIKVQPHTRSNNTSVNGAILFTSGDEADVAPGGNSSVPIFDLASESGFQNPIATPILTTNTSAQIGARAFASSVNLYLTTRGWDDWRRS